MPDARAELAFALGRPFAEQVAFFRGKLGNLVPTATWKDIQRSAHDTAFMVAGAAKADLLADLAAAVDKAIHDGEGIEAFRKRFGEIVKKHGWQGWTGSESKAGTAWRTRVIYRTNMATSHAAGRLAQLKHFPVWVYRHSGAEHPRLQHKAWDGLTLPADHDFWRTHYPPNGWGCGCRVAGASSADAARRLGGNPDYDAPPPGWDARDGKGRLPGIDEGWDYMPGGTAGDALRPFVPRLADDGDLPLACHVRGCVIEPGGEKPPMPAPRMASAERLLPAGMADEWYAQRFLAEFGAKSDEVHLFVDVTGHGLVIAADMFKNRAGEWKLKNGRERYLLLLADTIRSPDEIWQLVEKRDRGRLRVRRRYVARWLLPGEEVPALTVFEWGRDMWQPITAFQPDEVSYLERRGRLGNREWVRPDA